VITQNTLKTFDLAKKRSGVEVECWKARPAKHISINVHETSQELRMLSRSLSDCQSLNLNVMIRVSQLVRNTQRVLVSLSKVESEDSTMKYEVTETES